MVEADAERLRQKKECDLVRGVLGLLFLGVGWGVGVRVGGGGICGVWCGRCLLTSNDDQPITFKVMGERNILGSQLIRRNDELALLYEKVKLQGAALGRGAVQYRDRCGPGGGWLALVG